LANADVDDDIKNELADFIQSGQLVISGSANAVISTGKVDADLTLKFKNFPEEGFPDGTYTVVLTLRNLGVDDEDMDVEIKVNGVTAVFDL
jgi:hypothetical protein